MKPVIIVSADGHAGGRIEAYRDYLEAHSPGTYERLCIENDRYVSLTGKITKLSDEVYEAVDERRRLRDGGEHSVLDPALRLAEMDAESVAAEVLFPGHQSATTPCFTGANEPYTAEERAAGARAYNRWLADFVAAGQGRFVGVGDTGSSRDMDATVAEARWIADHGLGAINLPNIIADSEVPPIHHPSYEPFWRLCADRGLVLSMHAGWGGRQGEALPFFEYLADHGAYDLTEVNAPAFAGLEPRRGLWQVMLSGVFDRYPGLKLGLTECRADWIPATLAHLDARFARGGTPLTMKPSEYWARNCFVAPSSIRRSEIEMRYDIGVRNILFGVDYPHTEGTWPNTIDWIRATFRGVSEGEARQILGENAIEIYGFDRAKLEAVAARIGPIPSEVLGDYEIDPRKIAAFHTRSGYSFPAETVDTGWIDRSLNEDLGVAETA